MKKPLAHSYAVGRIPITRRKRHNVTMNSTKNAEYAPRNTVIYLNNYMPNKDAATSLTVKDTMCVIGEVTVTLIERRLARLITKPIASCRDAPASNRTDRQKSRCAYSNH